MKILIVNNLYYPNLVGGGEVSVQILAEGLKKIGHDVMVISLGDINNVNRVDNSLFYLDYPLLNSRT